MDALLKIPASPVMFGFPVPSILVQVGGHLTNGELRSRLIVKRRLGLFKTTCKPLMDTTLLGADFLNLTVEITNLHPLYEVGARNPHCRLPGIDIGLRPQDPRVQKTPKRRH